MNLTQKSYIIILIVFFCSCQVFGQGIKFGVHFDPALVWFQSNVNDIIPQKTHLGFDLGMSVDYFFAQNYAFATGISLFNTSSTLKYASGTILRTPTDNLQVSPADDVKYRIQYVKIPIALRFKTHRIGRMIYSANLGCDPLIRATSHIDFRDNKNIDANSEVKLFNLGWHFGGKAAYSLGGEAAIFGGLSFMNTFLDITTPTYDKITSKNLMLQLGVLF